jgi:hypothetical protein
MEWRVDSIRKQCTCQPLSITTSYVKCEHVLTYVHYLTTLLIAKII